MGLFRTLAREYLVHRLTRDRYRRRGGWGATYRPRPYAGRGRLYRAAPRGRTRVRVGGCCLPIPLGVLGTVVAGGLRLRRART